MSTQHTPGPWSIGSKGRFQQHIDGGPVGPKWFRLASVIVRLDDEDEDNAEGLANARLIAAAPDLLAEMERYLPILERLESLPATWALFTEGTGIATLNGYKAAISKATQP